MFEVKEFYPGLFRGPEPSSIADYDKLQQLGIKVTIDLEARVFDLPGVRQEFIDWQTDKRGMILWSVPMVPILPPRQSQLRLAAHLLWQSHNNTEPAYVHCRQGVDRTGMVVAAFRYLYRSCDIEDAIQEMKVNGFHPWYFYWIPALRQLDR